MNLNVQERIDRRKLPEETAVGRGGQACFKGCPCAVFSGDGRVCVGPSMK